jgi:hypothetical protein
MELLGRYCSKNTDVSAIISREALFISPLALFFAEKLWRKFGEPKPGDNATVEIFGDLWRSFGEMTLEADMGSR